MNIKNSRQAIHAQDSNLGASRFSNTNLAGTSFDNVNLTDATLNNVNLTNVRISDANLAGMTINDVLVSSLLRGSHDHARGCDHAAATSTFTSVMPVLRVQDMQRAIDWYTQVIGFALQWRSPNDGGGENCMLRAGPATLMLSTGTHLGDKPSFTGTLYFNTPGVSAFHERVKDKVDLIWPLENMEYGTVEFGVRDPDGYVLAFSERREVAE